MQTTYSKRPTTYQKRPTRYRKRPTRYPKRHITRIFHYGLFPNELSLPTPTPPELLPSAAGDAQGFQVDNDLLTPTLKMRRPQLLKYYQKKIDKMYEGIRAAEAANSKALV